MNSPPTTILVVDDNPANLAMLRKPLATSGHKVHTASGGFEAVRLAKELRPDLILLDIGMPRLDGIEACRILKSQSATAAIPVLFVTAHSDGERVTRAFAAGGCDFITKPIKVNEVLARVSVHLRLRRAERELIHKNEQLQELTDKLLETNSLLELQSRIDPLTRLLNRGAWSESAGAEHERSLRSDRGYAVAMIDVDHFKALNDSLGHAVGDDCLRRLASCANSVWRNIDLVGRYGGEEFIVLMPECDARGALESAARFRVALGELAIPHPDSEIGPNVTVSMGIAQSDDLALEEVIRRADAAMYEAKQSGRNQVRSADGPPEALRSGAGRPAPAGAGGDSAGQAVAGRVVIADPDGVSRTLCGTALRRAGYAVRECRDGSEALGEVRGRATDVVLLAGPGRSDKLAAWVRAIKSGAGVLPVVLLAEGDAARAALHAGADDVLIPPIRVDDLLARIRSMLRLARSQTSLRESLRERHALQRSIEEQSAELTALREHIERCTFDRDYFEKRVCDSERMLGVLLAHLRGAVYRCRHDEHRTMEFLSDGCGQFLGWSASDLIDNHSVAFADLIHQDDAPRVGQVIARSLAENRPFEVQYRIRTADGEERVVREQGTGVYSEGGELVAVEGLIGDVAGSAGATGGSPMAATGAPILSNGR